MENGENVDDLFEQGNSQNPADGGNPQGGEGNDPNGNPNGNPSGTEGNNPDGTEGTEGANGQPNGTEGTEEENNNEEETPLVEELITSLGFSFTGEDGKPKVYEESEVGLKELIVDVIKDTETKTLEKAKGAFFDAIPPRVKEFYNHIVAGKAEEEFYSDPLKDILNFVLPENDEDAAARVIRLRQNLAGFDEEETEDLIKGLKASNRLEERAKKDLVILQNNKMEQNRANAAKIQADALLEQQNNEKALAELSATITKGVVKNIEIPIKEREDFLKYMTVVNKEGKTQYQIDLAKVTDDDLLVDAYLIYKKGDYRSIVNNLVNKENAKKLRDRFNRTSNNNYNSNNSTIKEAEISDEN